MIARLILAIVIGVAVFLVCLLLGAILIALKVDVVETIGKFLQQWAVVIGALAGLLSFFTGWNPFGGRTA